MLRRHRRTSSRSGGSRTRPLTSSSDRRSGADEDHRARLGVARRAAPSGSPRTTPAIGLSPNTVRHGSGSSELRSTRPASRTSRAARGTARGTARRGTSRSAPRARARRRARSRARSRRKPAARPRSTCGATPYHAIIPKSTSIATARSTRPASTVATGMMIRGKYTFCTRFALPTSEFELMFSAVAKNVHGTSAVNEKIGYGIPSDGTLRELAEEEAEHDHREERLDHRPRRAERRLLVADLDVAPDQEVDQLAVFPDLAGA